MSTSTPADVMHLEIEADLTELARVRAVVRSWLPHAMAGSDAGEDALVVLSELVALAIEATEGPLPVEIRIRHTHSILVVEVDAPVASATAADLVGRFNRGDEKLGGVQVISLLADRAHADTGSRRVTFTCSIRFAA